MAECDMCGFEMELASDLEIGELLACLECGKEYEVKNNSPLKLDPAPVAEEDWGE